MASASVSGDTDMTGRVAIVTGGTRGIGEATARSLAARGATVVVSSRNGPDAPTELATSGTDRPGRIFAMRADAGRPEEVERLVAETARRFGRIDILVNNAGAVAHLGPVLEADLAAWDATFAINLRGAFVATKAAVAAWMGAHGGSVVNVASIAGLRATSGLGVYGVAKAGLILLTRQLAKELGPRGIRVNAVAPGYVETEFSRPLWSDPERVRQVVGANPSGRLGTAEEVARAIVFLASDAASYINGQALVIDGGALA